MEPPLNMPYNAWSTIMFSLDLRDLSQPDGWQYNGQYYLPAWQIPQNMSVQKAAQNPGGVQTASKEQDRALIPANIGKQIDDITKKTVESQPQNSE